MGTPQPIASQGSGITTFYVPPEGEPPNVYASFVSGFLSTRLPEAQAVFLARLKASDPKARYAALDSLEKYRVELEKLAASNEIEAAKLNNARDIESSQAKRDYFRSHVSEYTAQIAAGATRDAAAMGLEGHVIEAGKISPRSEDLLGDYRTREQDAQRRMIDAAKLDQNTKEGRKAYNDAQVELLQVAAHAKEQLSTIQNPVERTNLLKVMQNDPVMIKDAAGQEFVQQVRGALGTPQDVEVPIPHSGARPPPEPTDVDLGPADTSGGRARAQLERLRGGGSPPPAGGNAGGGARATTAPASSRSPAGPPGTPPERRTSVAPARADGSGGESRTSDEEEEGDRRKDSEGEEQDESSSGSGTAQVYSQNQPGTFNEPELQAELDRIKGMQAQMRYERMMDPTGGLGGHWDPLGSPGAGRAPAPRAAPRRGGSAPSEKGTSRSLSASADNDRPEGKGSSGTDSARVALDRLYGPAKPLEGAPAGRLQEPDDTTMKGPEKPAGSTTTTTAKKKGSALRDATAAAQERAKQSSADSAEGLRKAMELLQAAKDARASGETGLDRPEPEEIDEELPDSEAAEGGTDESDDTDTSPDQRRKAKSIYNRLYAQ